MLYGTSFVAARYAGICDFLHSGSAAAADAMHIAAASPDAAGKPSPSELNANLASMPRTSRDAFNPIHELFCALAAEP